jgi:hypothetical protein
MTWQCNVLHHHHPATQRRDRGQKRNTESGRKRYARYLRCIYMLFLTLNFQEGGFAPRCTQKQQRDGCSCHPASTRRNTTERGFPPLCCVSFHADTTRRGYPPLRRVSLHTDATRRGKPLPVVFPSTDTRRGGGNPFSVVFPSTQTRREEGNPFPLCFPLRICDEEGFTLLCCVSLYADATRRGLPPLCCVPFHTDTTRGGKPLPIVFPSRHDERR